MELKAENKEKFKGEKAKKNGLNVERKGEVRIRCGKWAKGIKSYNEMQEKNEWNMESEGKVIPKGRKERIK